MTLSDSILGGLVLASTAALFTTQGASEPMKSTPEYFVTAEGNNAHLWVREGNGLWVVGHRTCKDCALDAESQHKDGERKDDDGHDHGKPAKK